MPVIHIPTHMRQATDGRDRVEVPAGTVRSALRALQDAHPAIEDLILQDGSVRGDLAIAINSTITENSLLEAVGDGDEIHLVPSIAGG